MHFTSPSQGEFSSHISSKRGARRLEASVEELHVFHLEFLSAPCASDGRVFVVMRVKIVSFLPGIPRVS